MKNEMVFKVMTSNIIAADENTTMKQAAELMKKHRIRHLPITNQNGRIVGILSDRDIGRLRRMKTVNDFEERAYTEDKQPVKYHMNSPVLEVAASEPLQAVAKRMLHEKVSCFLIVDEYTAPCGIVTTDDLLRYFVNITEGQDREVQAPVGTLFQYLKIPTYE